MIAKEFVAENGTNVWSNEAGNVFSKALDITNESLDLATGWTRTERMLFWIKGTSEETVTNTVQELIGKINSGKLSAVRVFFKEPLYDGHQEDVNPSTGETLGRYSQVQLCPPAKVDELHRQFQPNPVKAEVSVEEDLPTA